MPTANSRASGPRTSSTPPKNRTTSPEPRLFKINGLVFGIAICHEGFRYPETVRWAASLGARIVFHPHCTGSDRTGVTLTQWGSQLDAFVLAIKAW